MKPSEVLNRIAEEIKKQGFDPEVSASVIEKLFGEDWSKNGPGSLEQHLVNLAQRRASEES